MAFSTTWDLEKYKSEFESDDHWQLRKKFMEAHKQKFPEDKLVCLARVFCNVEFLGCRYPEKTMKLVAELSKEVAEDYREKQKGKLKRTFVQASDAAGAKFKGTGVTQSDKITEGPPSKLLKTSDSGPASTGFKYTCFVHADLVVPPQLSEGEFPGFIIYENCKTSCPINILTQSAQKNKTWNTISFDFPAEKNPTNSERCCEISLNKKVLSSGVGLTNKIAKVNAAIEGLNKLRQTCYTIQEKTSFFSDGELVSKEQVVKGKDAPTPLPQDNIGSRMMMKMGWTGTGLGKNQQGIQAPIEAAQTMHRAGFGHLSSPQFHDKFRKVFKDYIASGSSNDLVFAPDFSSDERKVLHRLAQNMNLKTKSYGKDQQRHLVVYKVMTLPEILTNLLSCGGENDKYSLLHPQGNGSSSPSAASSHVIVDKENPNVSVSTVPTDVTKYDTLTSFLKLNPEPSNSENISHCPGVSRFDPCVIKTAPSINVEQKHISVPKTLVLNSDGGANSIDNLHVNLSTKCNEAEPSISGNQNMMKCVASVTNYDSDINVINRVIDMKKEEVTALHTGMEKLLEIYSKTKSFTKKERRRYNQCRRVLQNITGTFILNVLRPEWTIGEWKSGKVPKCESLNNFSARCVAVGLAEVENKLHLKLDVIRNVKKKLQSDKLIDNKKTRRAIKFECKKIGSKFLLHTKKGKSINKSNFDQNSKMKRKAINKCKLIKKIKQNLPKKKNKSLRKEKERITFVKETGEEFANDSSGMEYSDIEDASSELDE